MGNLAPVEDENLVAIPYRKIKVNNGIRHILHLPGGQRIIICSWDGSFQVCELERGTQISEEWEDKDGGVEAIALSPDGMTVATGSHDGMVKLWNVDTGKVIKKWTGHQARVHSVCWSPDGGRVVSGCWDATFRVWDVQSEETIIGPIKARGDVHTVCYSPDGKMMAISLYTALKILDANTGELLKTIDDVSCKCLAWTLDGKTLFAGGWRIRKLDTATWTTVLDGGENFVDTISISPNQRILASTSYCDKTAQLWNLETGQPIGIPLQHEDDVNSTTFSTDGKFLVIGCPNGHLYTWDISAIVKEAGLLSDIVSFDEFHSQRH
jgi:WD40 repeat protein